MSLSTKTLLRIELWFENGKPQFTTHITANPEKDFEEIKRQMIALRDRLTEEIENGHKCPHAPKE